MRDVVKRSKVGNFLQKMKNEYTRTKAPAREGAADATGSQNRIVLGTLPELAQRQSLTSRDLRSTLSAKSGLSRQVQRRVQGAWSAGEFSDQYFIDRAGG
jgi:hypothetical protein